MTDPPPSGGGRRILLIGCGELGSRHLQSVLRLGEVAAVDVVDPRPEALALGRERAAEAVPGGVPAAELRWLTSLEAARPEGALCITATLADVRAALVRQAAEALGYRVFLLEKIVTPSEDDYDDLLAFAAARGLAVWVNFKTRAYPVHRYVRTRLDPSEPIIFSTVGGNHGLATNGVHAVDLFAFFDGAERIESAGSAIDPVLHPSKRGAAFCDLSGVLHGRTRKGSHFTLAYGGSVQSSETITITTPRYRCIVDHLERWAFEGDEATGWSWRPIPFEGDLRVSAMTGPFVRDILTTGRCALPTLREAAPAHRFMLSELLPHFNRLLHTEGRRCPVT